MMASSKALQEKPWVVQLQPPSFSSFQGCCHYCSLSSNVVATFFLMHHHVVLFKQKSCYISALKLFAQVSYNFENMYFLSLQLIRIHALNTIVVGNELFCLELWKRGFDGVFFLKKFN
jgi:hypothetical protein